MVYFVYICLLYCRLSTSMVAQLARLWTEWSMMIYSIQHCDLLNELEHFLRRDFSVVPQFCKDGLHLVHGETVVRTNVVEDALEAI